MKVLVLDRGVGNPYSLGLVSGLRALGVEALIGGPAASGEAGVRAVYPRFGMRGKRLAKLADVPRALVEMVRVVRGFDPDVVHVQWAELPDLLYARAVKRLTPAGLVFTAHVLAPAGVGGKRQARILELADRVFAHGPHLEAQLRRAHPSVADRVRLVPHGNYAHVIQPFPREYARRRLGLSTSAPVYAFVGQIRPRKGVETLFSAFAAHTARGLPGQLLIVGTATEPAYRASLEELERQLGVAATWVVSASRLPQTALDLAVSAASQVVLPFHEATQSGSAIFAMTHGRCVVTSPVGEVGATVAGRGILTPPGDAASLATALARVVEDPEGCDRLGEKAREYALSELSWTKIAARSLAVYEEALA